MSRRPTALEVVAVVVAAACVMAVSLLLVVAYKDYGACRDAGGVMLQGQCVAFPRIEIRR